MRELHIYYHIFTSRAFLKKFCIECENEWNLEFAKALTVCSFCFFLSVFLLFGGEL